MRTMHQWLDEYGASHRNSTNELIHWICVPAIVMTVQGFLWSIPVPQAFTDLSPWLNWPRSQWRELFPTISCSRRRSAWVPPYAWSPAVRC
jgi:hypothetical protein